MIMRFDENSVTSAGFIVVIKAPLLRACLIGVSYYVATSVVCTIIALMGCFDEKKNIKESFLYTSDARCNFS